VHELPKFLVEGTQPNRKKIAEYVHHSLMLVTALAPVIATTSFGNRPFRSGE